LVEQGLLDLWGFWQIHGLHRYSNHGVIIILIEFLGWARKMTDEGLGDRVSWQRRHCLRQMWLENQRSTDYLGLVGLPLDQLHFLLQGQDAFDHLGMRLGEA